MCLPHAVQDGIKGTLPLYRGTLDAARSIVRQEGYQALYAGEAHAVPAGPKESAHCSA